MTTREPIPWRNGKGTVKWQPVDMDGKRLYSGMYGYHSWVTENVADSLHYSLVLYRSKRRAVRKANRRDKGLRRRHFEIARDLVESK